MKFWTLFLISILFVSCGDYCNDYLKPKKINGKITSKYIDERDHYLKKIIVIEKGQQYKVVIIEKNNELWDFIEEGDSIIKNTNYLDIIIKKKDNRLNTFNICN